MVHYILRRRQQQREYHGLIREADAVSQPLLYIFEDFIAEVLAELGPHLWRQRNNFREPTGEVLSYKHACCQMNLIGQICLFTCGRSSKNHD